MALKSLEVVQKKTTIETETKTRFLNYSASHPDAVTEYRISSMIPHIYSDVSEISEP